MIFVGREQMRAIDRRAIADYGIHGSILMERAGYAVAKAAWMLLHDVANSRRSVLVVCGRGNNGGDGFAAARFLSDWGARVRVMAACSRDAVAGDALFHLKKLEESKVSPLFLPAPDDWKSLPKESFDSDVIIDALLGTGSAGEPKGAVGSAIEFINKMSGNSLVLSVDIPSGMDPDTGLAKGIAVVSDLTVTIGLPKKGMANPESWEYTGSVIAEDIGFPAVLLEGLASDPEFVSHNDLKVFFGRRPRLSHKGDFGRVVIAAGSAGFAGAAAMAAMAAIRSGAGLVSVITPKSIAPTVAAIVPEAMVHGVEESSSGSLSIKGFESKIEGLVSQSDSVLVGPGMTANEDTYLIVRSLLEIQRNKPLIIDADGLNACTGKLDIFSRSAAKVAITPHPGELARLTNETVKAIQSDRIKSANAAAKLANCIVVLKGAGTVIAMPHKTARVNLTGNPGMATGGTGDLLAGLIAGFAAQKIELPACAEAAVWLHGFSGDRCSWKGSQPGLAATDILALLPETMRMIMCR